MKKIIVLICALFCAASFVFADGGQVVRDEKSEQVLGILEEVNNCKDLTSGQKFSITKMVFCGACIVGIVVLASFDFRKTSENRYDNNCKALEFVRLHDSDFHGATHKTFLTGRDDVNKPVWNEAHNELRFEQLPINK